MSVAYEVFGDGPRKLLLLPTWTIVHSDFWRLRVPHLMSRYTVVTFDGRGNGGSDRPTDPASYRAAVMVGDALAVMDETLLERPAVLSASLGAYWAALLAARHPDRVAASIFIAPYLPLGHPSHEQRASSTGFDERRVSYQGWQKYNRHYWREHWSDFLEFFFSQCFTEPDSRDYIDHFISMGLQTTPEILTLTADEDDLDEHVARELLGHVRCPTMVVHGREDAIAPVAWGVEAARMLGAELHVIPGGGHEPELRESAEVNQLIDGFLATLSWPPGGDR